MKKVVWHDTSLYLYDKIFLWRSSTFNKPFEGFALIF